MTATHETKDRRVSVLETPEGRAVVIEQRGPNATWKHSQNISLQGDEVVAVAEALLSEAEL